MSNTIKKRKGNSITHEPFLTKIYTLVGDEYKVLTTYVSSKEKILMKHTICGNEFIVTPSNFLKGRGCPKCKGKRISMLKTKTHNEFVERVFQLVGVQNAKRKKTG
ncbi:hypothetical protein P9Z94_29415 [Bacillus thuringiensis]|uniref:hypothetical protein n=1 Tax=Bacillus thuringiensis TaxID=1428 RepID=UPI002DB6CDC1|nr:hypothetical protein [Bacillus thuringiensis]MEC3160121.1 hypothetical protein [Bacillus thuringiensis]